MPTADNLFPPGSAGSVNTAGWISFCMANGDVEELGWNAQEARANPTLRAAKAMAPGLCAMAFLLSGLRRAYGVTRPILSEYHASQNTVLGETLVPVSENSLMNVVRLRRVG